MYNVASQAGLWYNEEVKNIVVPSRYWKYPMAWIILNRRTIMDILYPHAQDGNTAPEKVCTRCQNPFPATLEFFVTDKKGKNGLSSRCRICIRAYQRERRQRSGIRDKHVAYMKQYHQRPERQARNYEYNRTPERRAYMRSYIKERYRRPDVLAYYKAYYQRPEVKARMKGFYSTSEQKEKKRLRFQVYYQRPEVKEHMKNYGKEYQSRPEVKKRRHEWYQAYYQQPEVHKRMRAYGLVYNRAWRKRPASRLKQIMYANARRAHKKAAPGFLTPEQIRHKLMAQRYSCYYCQNKFEKRAGKYVYHLEHTIPLSRVEWNPRHDVDYVVLACPDCNLKKHNKLPHEWGEGGRLL